jgi:hypothetical protein
MSLDGIVRMVDAFFRHWDDTEKMWSEYERAGFVSSSSAASYVFLSLDRSNG